MIGSDTNVGQTHDAAKGHGSRRILRWVSRASLLLFFFLVCGVAWLEWQGLPAPWVARCCAYLAEQELFAKVSAIRFQFPASVVVEGLRLYESASDTIPLLEADRIRLGWSPTAALRYGQNVGTLRVRGATVILRGRAHGHDMESSAAPFVSIEQLNMYASFAKEGFYMGLVEGVWGGIKIHGDGFIENVPREPGEPPFSLKELVRNVRLVLAQAASHVPTVAAIQQQLTPGRAARLDFRLRWAPACREASLAEIYGIGYKAAWRGVSFDRWNVHMVITNNLLHIRALSFVQGGTRCIGQGTVNLTNGVAAIHVYSTLPPNTWVCFLAPTNILGCPIALGPKSRSYFELWAGPAPLFELDRHVSGWAEVRNTTVKAVAVQRFFVHAQRRGDHLQFDHLELALPNLRLAGAGEINIPSGYYEIRGGGGGDPRAILPWMPDAPADVIRELDVSEHLSVTGRVAGCFTNLQAFCLDGAGWGTNFVFRGVDITNFETAVYYSNDVLILRNMRVERPEGKATGWVSMDFVRERVNFDVESTLAPHAAARMIGSNAYAFLASYRFEDAAHIRSRGTVGYSTFEDTDLTAEISAARAGWDRFVVDSIAMHVAAQGQTIMFTNIQGTAYGGVFGGDVVIENLGCASSPPQYRVAGRIGQVDFNRFLNEVGGLTNPIYCGTACATARVTGVIGKGMGRTAEGAGSLKIRKGYLFRLPLLGGLSHLLSILYPGLGFATQTDLDADFVVADGAVCSDAIEMQGAVLSILGYGCCRFDGRLDFGVQVKLFRRSYYAYVVRFITLPVTKLFEFRLGGTISEPKWRPQNLPKELFLMFD